MNQLLKTSDVEPARNIPPKRRFASLLMVSEARTVFLSLYRREGIPANLYYRWNKGFLGVGKKRLAGYTTLEASSPEVLDLKK